MKREPLFNIPPVIIALLALLAFVHAVRTLVLSDDQDIEFLLNFAFIPARYDSSIVLGGALPGGFGAEVWTFLTYSVIHADWTHFGVNAVWLLPFGSALARRFGAMCFIAFFVVTAAAMRFAFQRGGPLSMLRGDDEQAYRVPAIPLTGVLSDKRILIFLGAWFGINILFGYGSLPITGSDQPVAWQAHIGGFLAGLLLFSWFDPAPRDPSSDTQNTNIGATRH